MVSQHQGAPALSYRIGIVGAGNISETHARAARDIPDVDVVAVWGDNLQKATRLAEQYGARAYRALDDFLRHPLDVVLIGSPSGVHAQHAALAARHGLHVLVEKPLDISTARIDTLIADCERAGVRLGVFFQDRAAPHIQWLRSLVLAGGLGRIMLASARVKWFRPPAYYADSRWRGTWQLDGGGAVMNQGIHTLDLMLWLLGDVRRVYAHARAALHAIEVEDTAIACLEFASGALATFEATTAAYPGFPRRLELTGFEGTVILESDVIVSADLRSPPANPLPPTETATHQAARSPAVANAGGHRAVLVDFLRALESGDTPLCDGAEARRSVALAEALYQSARLGEPVAVNNVASLAAAR
jgi:UDP-N-acetyl-2-amino-2-deoxyglucuronate dehydrogenase